MRGRHLAESTRAFNLWRALDLDLFWQRPHNTPSFCLFPWKQEALKELELASLPVLQNYFSGQSKVKFTSKNSQPSWVYMSSATFRHDSGIYHCSHRGPDEGTGRKNSQLMIKININQCSAGGRGQSDRQFPSLFTILWFFLGALLEKSSVPSKSTHWGTCRVSLWLTETWQPGQEHTLSNALHYSLFPHLRHCVLAPPKSNVTSLIFNQILKCCLASAFPEYSAHSRDPRVGSDAEFMGSPGKLVWRVSRTRQHGLGKGWCDRGARCPSFSLGSSSYWLCDLSPLSEVSWKSYYLPSLSWNAIIRIRRDKVWESNV